MTKNLKSKVLFCLANYPETRNSDIELTTRIWKQYHSSKLRLGLGGEVLVSLKDLFELPREDNVKRYRAKIQNEENRYLPTEEKIAKARKINIELWRKAMGYYPRGYGYGQDY